MHESYSSWAGRNSPEDLPLADRYQSAEPIVLRGSKIYPMYTEQVGPAPTAVTLTLLSAAPPPGLRGLGMGVSVVDGYVALNGRRLAGVDVWSDALVGGITFDIVGTGPGTLVTLTPVWVDAFGEQKSWVGNYGIVIETTPDGRIVLWCSVGEGPANFANLVLEVQSAPIAQFGGDSVPASPTDTAPTRPLRSMPTPPSGDFPAIPPHTPEPGSIQSVRPAPADNQTRNQPAAETPQPRTDHPDAQTRPPRATPTPPPLAEPTALAPPPHAAAATHQPHAEPPANATAAQPLRSEPWANGIAQPPYVEPSADGTAQPPPEVADPAEQLRAQGFAGSRSLAEQLHAEGLAAAAANHAPAEQLAAPIHQRDTDGDTAHNSRGWREAPATPTPNTPQAPGDLATNTPPADPRDSNGWPANDGFATSTGQRAHESSAPHTRQPRTDNHAASNSFAPQEHPIGHVGNGGRSQQADGLAGNIPHGAGSAGHGLPARQPHSDGPLRNGQLPPSPPLSRAAQAHRDGQARNAAAGSPPQSATDGPGSHSAASASSAQAAVPPPPPDEADTVDTGFRTALYDLGVAMYSRGEEDQACGLWAQAAAAGHPGAAYDLGVVRFRRGDLEDAERWWRTAADRREPRAMAGLAELLDRQGNYAEARVWRTCAEEERATNA